MDSSALRRSVQCSAECWGGLRKGGLGWGEVEWSAVKWHGLAWCGVRRGVECGLA